MPGILGVVDPRLPGTRLRALAAAMAARLAVHEGLRVELDGSPRAPAILGRVDLGRLDPAPAPAQSPDGACRLVLHGEIPSIPGGACGLLDTYLTRGPAALRGLSGSFAAALWDGRASRLLLFNDRFGLRNVYYAAADARRLLFAPQVSSLLADARVSRAVDPQAMAEFLTFQCVLGDRTLLEAVRMLPPATMLVFEPGRRLALESTWQPRYRVRRGTPDTHARDLAEALRGATGRLAGGPARVGLPLSGGLDSRALLAALPAGVRPPTITYGRTGSDDAELAADLAALAGTAHHTIPLPVGCLAAEAATMVARTDGMHLCLNAHAALLREAAEVCDVVLLGNGGDCLLDGLWDGDPDAGDDVIVARLLSKLQLGLPLAASDGLVAPEAPFAEVPRLAATGLCAALADVTGDTAADRVDAFNVRHRHRRWVLQGVPAQATHVDYRHPYYDEAVVAVALGVPAALRHERRAHVEALRVLSPELAAVRRQGRPYGFAAPAWRTRAHAVGERVRDAVRWRANRVGLNPLLPRPSRRGFADYNDELRGGSRALLETVLLGRPTLDRGWWRPERLWQLVASHLGGRGNHANALGVVLTLELFARQYLDGPAASA